MKDSFMKKLIILTLLSLHLPAQLCAMDRKSPMTSSPHYDLKRATEILDDLDNDMQEIYSDLSSHNGIDNYDDRDASHPQRVKANAEQILQIYAQDIEALKAHCDNPSTKLECQRLTAMYKNLTEKYSPNSTPINAFKQRSKYRTYENS